MAIVFVTRNGFPCWVPNDCHLGFPTMAGGAWLIVRKHPKMFQLWGLSLSQKSYYDPRKHVNPFALEPTESNIKFLYCFVELLADERRS